MRTTPTTAGILRTAAAAMLVIVAACSDSTSTLTAPAAPAAARALRAGTPTLFPNSVKYRDQGTHPVGGRSGSASLTARALMQPGGVRVLASTGDVDLPGSERGVISKIQAKLFDERGRLVSTTNLKNTAGTVAFTLPNAVIGYTVQLQANVRGIDGNRTDVVTINVPVVRAPDLTVTLPPAGNAVVGMPVDIVATIVDSSPTGTRANCVLYVNGVLVDRADGIWVDGSDAVSCAFTTTFDGVGPQQVTVVVENLVAGDLTPTNNTAEMTMQVGSATPTVSFTASVDERYSSTMSRLDYQFLRADGTSRDYASTDSTTERSQSMSLVGSLTRAVAFPVASVASSWSSAGSTWDENLLTGLVPQLDDQGRDCVDQLVAEQGAHLFVCSTGTGATGVTAFSYTRFSGRITYHSSGFANDWDGVNMNVYTWNDTYQVYGSGGAPRLLGETAAMHFTFTDALGTVSADPVIALSPYREAISATPYACTLTHPDGGNLNMCTAAGVNAWGVRGSVTQKPAPARARRRPPARVSPAASSSSRFPGRVHLLRRACQGPADHGIVRLVRQRVQVPVEEPVLAGEGGADAGPVAPRARDDAVGRKAGLRQEVAQPRLRP
ncbi:MAG TPA: hypothetical protein VFH27_13955, partial [Longimicrobiaceae bacterium]|nr:hypothetical protein [Longimicrobiaceae bacterium]